MVDIFVRTTLVKSLIVLIVWSILLPQGFAGPMTEKHCAGQNDDIAPHTQESPGVKPQDTKNLNDHNTIDAECNSDDCCPAVCASSMIVGDSTQAFPGISSLSYLRELSLVPAAFPDLLLRPPIV